METSLAIPFFGMMALTVAVWVYMYICRLSYILSHGIPAQDLTTPDKLGQTLPEAVNLPAYNLKNLFELPILFYAACLFQFIQGSPGPAVVYSAYLFFGLRIVHSLIHCTFNWVILRFIAYALGAIALFVMIAASFLQQAL